ncbi:hypothetical protein R6Q59_035335 [Mikania micrantha]
MSFLEENENNFVDADIVRLSLLLPLYSLFMGVETDKRVEKEHLMLVDDFKAWNEFNWGSYLWGRTYPSILNVLMKKKTELGKKLKYSMTGFVWVFKWLKDSFDYITQMFQSRLRFDPPQMNMAVENPPQMNMPFENPP